MNYLPAVPASETMAPSGGGDHLTNVLSDLNRQKIQKETNTLHQNMFDRQVANDAILQQRQAKKDEMESTSKLLSHSREGLAWAKAQVETTGTPDAYQAYVDHMTKELGVPAAMYPPVESFMDKTTNTDGSVTNGFFNKDRFKAWSDKAIQTSAEMQAGNMNFEMKLAYGPDGKTMVVPIKKGEKYDPTASLGTGWTFEKPVAETLYPTEKGYQPGSKAQGLKPFRTEGGGEDGKPSNRKKMWKEYNDDLKKQGKPTITYEQFTTDEADRNNPLKPTIRKAVGDGTPTPKSGGPVKAQMSPDGKTITMGGKQYPVANGEITLEDGTKMRVKK